MLYQKPKMSTFILKYTQYNAFFNIPFQLTGKLFHLCTAERSNHCPMGRLNEEMKTRKLE